MIKAFYINLKKDTERRSFMESQFTTLGIPWERIEAINGREYDFKEEYDSVLSKQKNGKELTKGELGCVKSHKICWEKIISENYDYGLIMEDDVELPNNFAEIIEKVVNDNKKRHVWDYLQFDYHEPGGAFYAIWFTQWKRTIQIQNSILTASKVIIYGILKIPYIIIVSLFESIRNSIYKHTSGGPVYFARPLYLAGCYIVSIQGAQQLLNISKKILYPADRVHNQARKKGLAWRAYAPLIVKQKREKYGSSIIGVKGSKTL